MLVDTSAANLAFLIDSASSAVIPSVKGRDGAVATTFVSIFDSPGVSLPLRVNDGPLLTIVPFLSDALLLLPLGPENVFSAPPASPTFLDEGNLGVSLSATFGTEVIAFDLVCSMFPFDAFLSTKSNFAVRYLTGVAFSVAFLTICYHCRLAHLS